MSGLFSSTWNTWKLPQPLSTSRMAEISPHFDQSPRRDGSPPKKYVSATGSMGLSSEPDLALNQRSGASSTTAFLPTSGSLANHF